MIRSIGRARSGDLAARDILGSYHAVKIIRRDSFPNATPSIANSRGSKVRPILPTT